MTERRTEIPRPGDARVVMEGTEMSVNEITVRPAAASFAAYIANEVGDVDTLSFEEVVELTFAFHAEWQGSDVRRAERDSAREAKAVEAAARKAARDAERAERTKAEAAKLVAKMKELGIDPGAISAPTK